MITLGVNKFCKLYSSQSYLLSFRFDHEGFEIPGNVGVGILKCLKCTLILPLNGVFHGYIDIFCLYLCILLMVLTETSHERLKQSPVEQSTFPPIALLVYRRVTSHQPIIW